MKIFFLGDIVGRTGRLAVIKNLKNILERKKINFVIVNGENAADQGVGITEEISNDLFNAGVDVITTGKSSMECVKLINKSKAKLVGFASIIDRSIKKNLKIKKKIVSHLKINVPTFKSNKIPSKLKSIPITTPGSRFIK